METYNVGKLQSATNDYPYLQPPMRKGQGMLPLRFMTKPSAIDNKTYERYKKQIYKYVYKFEEE
ncbi:MAG: hypothetical protein IIU70_05920 [Anaerotignum sp.]|nr:hypothetical protein [Anaerotignum sp.]